MDEITLYYQGEIFQVEDSFSYDVSEVIKLKRGFSGIDLTCYSVVYATYRRGWREKVKELHKKHPTSIIVYQYLDYAGWSSGGGVIFPEHFDPSHVIFYKTARDKEEEEESTQKKFLAALEGSIRKEISGVDALSYHGRVRITPAQEVYCLGCGWAVFPRSLDEAKEGVAKMRSIWQEWNSRALAIALEKGIPNPGKGSIGISPAPGDDVNLIKISYSGRHLVRMARKEDGSWTETSVAVR